MIFSGSSFEALGICRVVRVEGESYAHTVVPHAIQPALQLWARAPWRLYWLRTMSRATESETRHDESSSSPGAAGIGDPQV